MASYKALWRARLRLLRPGNAIMAAVAVAIGYLIAASQGTDLDGQDIWLGLGWLIPALAAALVTAAGNVANDVLDADIDRTAHPERAIPSGLVSIAGATMLAVFLLASGLLAAWWSGGWPLLAFAAVNAAVLWAYEVRLKRLPLVGNIVVGALVASTLAFGAVAAGTLPDGVLWVMMATMALSNLAREVLKDIEDMDADAGRRTWPMVVGPGVASWTATVALGLAIGLAAVLALQGRDWSGPLLWAAAAAFVVASGLGCWQASRGQRALKVAMLVALVAFAVYAWGR